MSVLKTQLQILAGFSVPKLPTQHITIWTCSLTGHPLQGLLRVVGCIANDLFPHLSMYPRAFFSANAFWFLSKFLSVWTGSACVKVGMRTRFGSGCPSEVGIRNLASIHQKCWPSISIQEIFWTLTSVASVITVLMKILVKLLQEKLLLVNLRQGCFQLSASSKLNNIRN